MNNIENTNISNKTYTDLDKPLFNGIEKTKELVDAFKDFKSYDRRVRRIIEVYESNVYIEGLTEKEMSSLIATGSEVEEYVELSSIYIAINSGIERLPKIQKAVIRCYYFDNLTQEDIAERLNLERTTILYHLRKAEENLRRYLLSIC